MADSTLGLEVRTGHTMRGGVPTAQGRKFEAPPEERVYGIEAVMEDGPGNRLSTSQPKTWQEAQPSR